MIRKIIVLSIVVFFTAGLIGSANAAGSGEIQAYIGLLKTKLNQAIDNNQAERAAKLTAMITTEEKRLRIAESMEAAPTKLAVPPIPELRQVVKPAKPEAGSLLGWGLPVSGQFGYNGNQAIWSARFDVMLSDPLGLASWIGMPSNALFYRIGVGYFDGSEGGAAVLHRTAGTPNFWRGNSVRAIPVYADGVLMLPTDWFEGLNAYFGAGLNYLVARTGGLSGSVGGQMYLGIIGNTGLLDTGKSFAQIGYEFYRSGTCNATNSIWSKSYTFSVGHTITL